MDDASATELVAELLLAHEYWRLNTLSVDLVLLNEDRCWVPPAAAGHLLGLVARSPAQSHLDQPGGVFVLRGSQLSESDRRLLLAAARVVLSTSGGRLGRQLARAPRPPDAQTLATKATPLRRCGGPRLEPLDLVFANGRGGFTPDGRQYVIDLPPGETTPAPWSNVVASPEFGFLVTESGSGFTWHGNSQANRLTPWSNDPLSDPVGEAIYLQDQDSGSMWSPTPLPSPGGHAYRVRHGQGASWFEHTAFGVQSELVVCVPPKDTVKVRRLRLRNVSDHPRRLSATVYVEWVLGSTRDRAAAHVSRNGTQALLHCSLATPTRTRRAASPSWPRARSVASFTADRAEFLGRNGSRASPSGLQHGRGPVGSGRRRLRPVRGGPGRSWSWNPARFVTWCSCSVRHVAVEDAPALIGAYRSPAAAARALDAALG